MNRRFAPGWASRVRAAAARKPAFTLIEVIVALAIMILMVAVAFSFFSQVGVIRAQASSTAERTQLAKHVLERIAAELRGCVGFDQVGFPVEQRLAGQRRSITFLTTSLPDRERFRFLSPDEEPPPAHADLSEVGYQLWCDPQEQDENGQPIVAGIIRSEKKTLNQYVVDEEDPLEIRHELEAADLKYLEFRYFDGAEWDTKWEVDQGNSLPHLVLIIVGFNPITDDELNDRDLQDCPLTDPECVFGGIEPHPDRYMTVVRIPAADQFFGARVQRVGQQVSEQLGLGEAAP